MTPAQAGIAPPMVRIDGVGKRFEIRDKRKQQSQITQALADVSLEIGRGEFISFLGPSGCGKTTLLRLVAGLLRPDGGSITVAGQPVTGPRKDCCMVFQHFGLLPWRTVLRNVEFPMELDGVPEAQRRETATKFIRLVGLNGTEERFPHELSGGMQQRVGIARALTREPVLLLMDEPFGALDAQTREQLQEEFRKIWVMTKNTVVFVTHSIEEALVLSNRIVVFTTGPGRIKEIVDDPLGPLRNDPDVRSLPEFGKCRGQLRAMLRD
jgi:NitT/TauT family transport system ATP-binding protein